MNTATLLAIVFGALVVLGLLVRRLGYRDFLLFAIAFTMPLRNASLLELPGVHLRIGDVVIVVATVLLALEFLLGRSLRLHWVEVLLGLFVLWSFCTVAWSLDPQFGIARAVKYARNLALLLVVATWSRGRLEQALRWITAGAVGSFVYLVPALVAAIGEDGLSELTQSGGWSSELAVFRGAAESTAFTAMISTLAWWCVVAAFLWLATGLWAARQLRWQALFWIGLLVIAGTLAATFSRGVWVGMAVGGSWWWLQFARWSPRRAAASVVGGLALTVPLLHASGLLPVIWRRLGTILAPAAEVSMQQRFVNWDLTWQAWLARPFGLGLGATTVSLGEITGLWFVHDLYLQLLAEVGPVGLGLALGALGTALWRAHRAVSHSPCRQLRLTALSLECAVVAYLVTGLVLYDFTETEIWMILGLIVALPLPGVQKSAVALRAPSRYPPPAPAIEVQACAR